MSADYQRFMTKLYAQTRAHHERPRVALWVPTWFGLYRV